METVLIVIHLMVVVALVAIVLLQRSEGGALGMGGGGGGGGGFMSARGAGNALTKTTGILAAAFFATSLSLGVLAKINAGPSSVLDQIQSEGSEQGGSNGLGDLLNLPSDDNADPNAPAVPLGDGSEQTSTPSAPSGTTAPATTPQAPATGVPNSE